MQVGGDDDATDAARLDIFCRRRFCMVCGLINIPIPVYRDFIHGAAQPKRLVWANARYWYMSAIANGREWMQRMMRERSTSLLSFGALHDVACRQIPPRIIWTKNSFPRKLHTTRCTRSWASLRTKSLKSRGKRSKQNSN